MQSHANAEDPHSLAADGLLGNDSAFARGAAALKEERGFILFVVFLLVLVGITFPVANVARWIAFGIAAYSTVANDSVQTLGTFLGSNRERPWWQLWLFIGGIFLLTMTYSWFAYGGDVTFGRLAHKSLETTPGSFTFLQVAAPIVLLVLTRFGIPVSTTLLLLSCFAANATGLGQVLLKSFAGYGVAFLSAIVIWLLVSRLLERIQAKPSGPGWRIAQWCTTGLLWSVWLMQDASNVAVFLPRSLSVIELIVFLVVILGGLAWLFRSGGEKVQRVVEEKARVTDVRAATAVDLVYALVLYLFKVKSNVPMSTTWVFVGLLAGREVAMSLRGVSGGGVKQAFRVMGRDLLYVTIGLAVSLVVAYLANSALG